MIVSKSDIQKYSAHGIMVQLLGDFKIRELYTVKTFPLTLNSLAVKAYDLVLYFL